MKTPIVDFLNGVMPYVFMAACVVSLLVCSFLAGKAHERKRINDMFEGLKFDTFDKLKVRPVPKKE